MSLDLGLGAFVGESSKCPHHDPFLPWSYYSQLSIDLYATPSIEDSCFVLPSCLDGAHQGASLACVTTHNEYLMQKFDPLWHGLSMVCHVIPKSAYEFIYYEQDH